MRSVSNLQGTVREVIADLWSSISEGAQDDREILSRLEELEGAIQQGDPEVIRAQATQAVRVIGRTIQQRQHRQDARLSTLRNQLGRVRADLMEARNQNTIDALTGLKNRGALDADLERMAMLAEISAEPLSAALLDLDHFKWVNDTYGHQAGDAVLKRTAEEMIRAFPRKSDYLARYGGEEFTVVLPNTSAIDALRLVNRFLESMRALEVELGNQKIKVTCSAGVATLNERETQMDLLKRADAALYRAKSAGRDQAKLAD